MNIRELFQGVADPITGRVHLVRSKCDTCIFHPGNRMHLRPGRVRDMCEDSAQGNGHITCHKTLTYSEDPLPDGVCNGHATAPAWAPGIEALRYAQSTGLAAWVDTARKVITYQRDGHPVDPARPAERWLTREEANLQAASYRVRDLPCRAAPVPHTQTHEQPYGWTVYLGMEADPHHKRSHPSGRPAARPQRGEP